MKTPHDGYKEAIEELKQQHKDIAILEEGTIAIAKGMSKKKTPFLQTERVLEQYSQLRDTCHANSNVKLVDDCREEDIALALSLPNITIYNPCDYNEAKKATIAAATKKGPVYIRLHNGKEQLTTAKTEFTTGRPNIIRAGKHCTIIATGTALTDAVKAAEKLAKQEIECTVLNVHSIPVDKHAIISTAQLTGCIVTIENHSILGGLGSHITEITAQHAPTPVRILSQDKDTINKIIRAVKEVILQRCTNVCTTMPEEHGRLFYQQLEPELHFKIHSGGDIKTLPGLAKALLEMNEETFTHHCNEHKNDFCEWIKNAVKEPALAKQISQNKTKIGMALTILKWIE